MMHLKLVVKVDTAATIFDNTAYTHTQELSHVAWKDGTFFIYMDGSLE